ncbi:MAG: ribosomal RNA small subunit methyltransferase A [Bacteroidales bacterium]|nr:ribosomal RNA small subunit methyltransferase A [Bacteroidales bacterium]
MEVRAKKALGQHFLTDQSIARHIVDTLSPAGPLPEDRSRPWLREREGPAPSGEGGMSVAKSTGSEPAGDSIRDVLEIGPGMGVLTQYLLQRDDIDLKAVELDGESVDYLLTHFPGLQGRLLQADFLRLPLERIFPGPFRVIGNFPYNISSQIFFKVLDHKDRIPEVVGMVQKEVAERIAEKPGSKTYGILSVLLQAWYDIEYCFTVGSGAFAPPPKVQSAVIRLTRNGRTSLGCDEKLFKQVVKTAFNQRRKTLRNALKPLLRDSQSLTQLDLVKSNQVSLDKMLELRAERLSVEDFAALTNAIGRLNP